MFVVGSSLKRDSSGLAGGNLPVNAGAIDKRDITAHNSPALARNPVDPSNLALVNRIDTPRYSCAFHISGDAGMTWEERSIPFPEGEEAPPRCYAPDIAFGPDGTVYVAFVTLKGPGNVPNAVWLASSDDRGRTLAPPVRAAGPLAFQVRLSADPKKAGRLHLSWLQASETATFAFPATGNPIFVARSDDGGTTWQEPVRVSPPSRSRVVAPSTAMGPRGELYLLYLDVGKDALDYHGGHRGRGGEPYSGSWSMVLARSTDEGATWRETVVEEDVVPTQRFIAFLPPYPSVAVNQRNGRIHVAFHDGRLGDADVWLWTSEDRGVTFTAANRVNDTRPKDGTSQNLPKLAVAPDGRLDVLYYDRRADPDDVMTEVSFQSSLDGGRTFEPSLRLSDRAFDTRIGGGGGPDLPDLGSRLALVAAERWALAVWTDTRAGTDASKKQDLARAVIAFSEGSALREPLQVAGVALFVVGLGALALFGYRLRGEARGSIRRRYVEDAPV